jgi:hypothetical protein
VTAALGAFDDESAVLKGELSKTAFAIPPDLSFDEWAEMGSTLVTIAQAAMWWVGDWLRYGEFTYGDKYLQAVEATGYAASTLKNAQWVADRFPPEERDERLTHSHYVKAAGLEKSVRTDLLRRAADEGMSVGEVAGRAKVLAAKAEEAERPKAGKVEVIDPEPPTTRTEAIDLTMRILWQAIEREDWSLVKRARATLALCADLP